MSSVTEISHVSGVLVQHSSERGDFEVAEASGRMLGAVVRFDLNGCDCVT